MNSSTVTTVQVDGMDTAIHRLGDGAPCLYLHSELGETGQHPAIVELADAGYCITAPVLPGFTAGSTPDWVDLSDVVFWLGRLLDELELNSGDLTVIGSGLGGWLAAEVAVWYPRSVARLGLVGAAGLRVDGSAVADIFRGGLGRLSELMLAGDGDLEELMAPPGAIDPDARRLHLYRSLEATARIAWVPFFFDPRLAERLGGVACPASVVWGGDDRVVPVAHGREYERLLPAAKLDIVEGAGHLALLEQPAAVIRSLRPTA